MSTVRTSYLMSGFQYPLFHWIDRKQHLPRLQPSQVQRRYHMSGARAYTVRRLYTFLAKAVCAQSHRSQAVGPNPRLRQSESVRDR
jgi:hypothetical protein